MNLSDNEILEVHELCSALADDRATDAQQKQLGDLLKSSEEARTIYFHSVSLSASLAEYAGEMQSDAPAPNVHRVKFATWATAVLAAAACIALGIFIFHKPSAPSSGGRDEIADAEMQSGALVARMTGAKDCSWNGAEKLQPGDVVRRGQRIDLAAGRAEITFDCGAQLVLEGPAVLDVVSAWEATLERGGLKATVPQQAIGFRVHHKSVEVVDLGTEFSMVADAGGDAEVRVLKGAVEVSPLADEENAPVVLKESETRRFGKNRKGARGDFESRHARLAQATKLDRWNERVNFAHWSFDEAKDGVFKGQSSGLSGTFDASPATATLTDGRWDKALHFDGHHALTATAPGISRSAARAVAFWIRVPEDAQLPDAHAMVAWPVHSKRFGNRPLQIGWNRNPNQGPLGALRTELGKIYAVGATPLRDGKWHHIAVAFVPIGPGDGPLQVTQYVDGRLEGSTVRAIKVKHPASDPGATDVVWLGRAPGKHAKDKGHFRGDMDELFITDRALSQPEIFALMTQNALPSLDLTDAGSTTTGLFATF
jgi:ferric-dicitrate binding protein FerR (iron transport regulator)